jgi:hypothetical protein
MISDLNDTEEDKGVLVKVPSHYPLSKSGSFYKDYDRIKNRNKFQQELKVVKARLDLKEREEQRKQHEILEHRRKELELQKLRQLEAWKQEQELKTKRYFQHNQFHRKVPVEGNPYYKGDIEASYSGWMPHGNGAFFIEDESVMDGVYNHGEFLRGKVVWKHGYIWEGQLWKNLIHGMGVLTKSRIIEKKEIEDNSEEEFRVVQAKRRLNFNKRFAQIQDKENNSGASSDCESTKSKEEFEGEDTDPKQYIPREAVAYKGEIVCFRDQLQDGLQIEFQEPIMLNYKTIDGFLPRVTLLKHVEDWKYLCRFHQETWPRERIVLSF